MAPATPSARNRPHRPGIRAVAGSISSRLVVRTWRPMTTNPSRCITSAMATFSHGEATQPSFGESLGIALDGRARRGHLRGMATLRVALVTETFPPEIGGVALCAGRFVEALRAQGAAVHVTRPRQASDDRDGP